MKKLIVFMALAFAFSGCSNSVSASPEEIAKAYENDFSASVKANFGENESEMSVIKNSMSISFSVNYPKELSGMEIEIFDEHANISYNGMEQEIKKDSLPERTPFLLLEELFKELSNPEDFVLSTENGNLIARSEDFSAALSAEDFSLISAEFPLFETKFTFSDFEFSQAE